MITTNHQTLSKKNLAPAVTSTKSTKAGTVKSSAMTLVVHNLLIQPHTCASLVQKIGVYSASHINHCLRKLRKADQIGAVWDFKQKAHIYYNIKLEKADSNS